MHYGHARLSGPIKIISGEESEPGAALDLGAYPTLTVGPRPLPPFGLPAPVAPLDTIEDDPDFLWIGRTSLALVILLVLYGLLQFARVWIGSAW